MTHAVVGGGDYRDGYVSGQHDAINWLTIGDGDDWPLAPIDELVQQRAWAWCLAHNLAIGAALCRAHHLGSGVEVGEWRSVKLSHGTAHVPPPYWTPGCGQEAP